MSLVRANVIQALEALPQNWSMRTYGAENSLAAISELGGVAILIVEGASIPTASGLEKALAEATATHGAGLGGFAYLAGITKPAELIVPDHILFADELPELPVRILARSQRLTNGGTAPIQIAPMLGITLLGNAAHFVQETQEEGPSEPSQESLIASLKKPLGSKSLRARQTRAINDDRRVIQARAEVELRLGSWFQNPAKARAKFEALKIDPQMAATKIAMGDKRFGERSQTPKLPDDATLSAALKKLYITLEIVQAEIKSSIRD